jgi:hypothetical protein
MRRKLSPFGIEIDTVWGIGWRLSDSSRAAALALIEAESDGLALCQPAA